MTKHMRVLILIGQILSLVFFAYSTFIYGILAYYAQTMNDLMLTVTARVLEYLSLAEVIIAIIGIVAANRPIPRYRLFTPIVSAVFNGLFFILLMLGVASVGTGVTFTFLDYFLLLGMLTACVLLIIGAVQAHQEKKNFKAPVYLPNPPVISSGAYGPTPVEPSMSHEEAQDETLPISGKTAEELSKLKKLYEYKLIDESEYKEKKRKILDKEFSTK